MNPLELLVRISLSLLKWLVTVAVAGGVLAAIALGVFSIAFPKQRSVDFEHLVIPDSIADCYSCHAKMTPKLAYDWYESAHRVKLVKCSGCHGHPDGTGAIPFTARPDSRIVCGECHGSAIRHMEENFGIELECSGCHPFHQTSMHGAAYREARSEGESVKPSSSRRSAVGTPELPSQPHSR